MSVQINVQGDGRLQYPAINLKPALANGEGWWLGFWVRTQTTLTGASSHWLGVDANNNGNMAEAQDNYVGGGTSSTPRLNTGYRAASTDAWVAGGVTAIIPSGNMTVSTEYMVLYGFVDLTGAGDWRIWRVVVAKNGTVLGASQVTAGAAIITSAAIAAGRGIDRIFQDVGTVTRTAAGVRIEHVACVKGVFPFVAGAPSVPILEGLANGTYKWDSPAVLNGGTILDWRPLLSISDLGDISGNGNAALTLPDKAAGGANLLVSGSAPIAPWSTITITGRPDGYVFEGIRGASAVVYRGTKLSSQSLEVQITRTDASVVRAWSATGITYPTSITWRIDTTLPVNSDSRDYLISVRDAANTSDAVTAGGAFSVGAVIVLNDQSQFAILGDYGKAPAAGALSSVTANNIRVARITSRYGDAGRDFQVARMTGPASHGSGYVTMADQLGIDFGANGTPVMLVDVAVEGCPITSWISDVNRGLDQGYTGSWPIWSGYMTFMAQQCEYRATALVRSITIGTGSHTSLDTFIALFDGLWVNNIGTIPVWLQPVMRSSNALAASVTMRQGMLDKANTGGRWSLLGWYLDTQSDSDGNNHQAAAFPSDLTGPSHIAGNMRLGRKIGRAIGAKMQALLGLPVTLDVLGPQIVSIGFTSTARTAFDITYDRDVETPSGATTGLPQMWVSTDGFASSTELTGDRISARVVRVTKPSGDWIGAALRFDYLRDTPWNTTGGANGGEAGIRTRLDTILYDTSSFEGGRGIHAPPILGTGLLVADFSGAPSPSLAAGAPLVTFSGFTAGSSRAISGAGVVANKLAANNANPLLVTGIVVGSAGLGSGDIGVIPYTVTETLAGAPNSPRATNLTLEITA